MQERVAECATVAGTTESIAAFFQDRPEALPPPGGDQATMIAVSTERADRTARVTWAAYWCVVAVLAGHTFTFQDSVPYYDDWLIAKVTVERTPLTLDWLWAQHNEHRMPGGKLLAYLSFRYLGLDARPLIALNLIFLAAAAALVLAACRDLRGRYALQDVAVPLLLAGLGHDTNVLWAFQVSVTLAVFLFSVALRCMVRAATGPPGGCASSFLAAGAGVLLLTTGAYGTILGIAVALWCAWQAIRLLTRGRGACRLAGILLAAGPLIVCAHVVLYFQGLRQTSPLVTDVGTLIKAVAGVATVGLGPATTADLPWGWTMMVLAVVGSLALAVCVARAPGDRARSIALLAGMLGGWGLIGAIAMGRGNGGIGAALVPRYVSFSALGVVALYLAGVHLEARRLGYLLTLPILVALAWRQPASIAAARDHGIERVVRARAFASDVALGARLQTLVRRHRRYFTEEVADTGEVASCITVLDLERVGPFADPGPRLDTRPEPLREIEVRLTPLEVHDATLEAGEGKTLGEDSWLCFALDTPAHMVGVRLEMTIAVPGGGGAAGQIYWGLRGRNPLYCEESSIGFAVEAGQAPFTVWCEGTLDMLRLDPDNKAGTRFKVSRIVVLAVPE